MKTEEEMKKRIDEMEEEEIQMEKKRLREQIDLLERQRMELKVKQGIAFHCRGCRKIVMKSSMQSDEDKEELCWVCYDIKRNTEERERLLKKLKNATVTDLSLTRGNITDIILEDGSKKFIIGLDCWEDDHHMVIEEEKYLKDF